MPARSAATSMAPGSFPSLAFVEISQAEAALTKMTFAIVRDEGAGAPGEPAVAVEPPEERVRVEQEPHQRSQASSSSSGSGSKNAGSDPGPAAHCPELPADRLTIDRDEADNRRGAPRNHDVFAGAGPFDQPGEVGFGRVNRVGLSPSL